MDKHLLKSNYRKLDQKLADLKIGGCSIEVILHSASFFTVPLGRTGINERRGLLSLSLLFVPGKRHHIIDLSCGIVLRGSDGVPAGRDPPRVAGWQFISLENDTAFLDDFGELLKQEPCALDGQWRDRGYEDLFSTLGVKNDRNRAIWGTGLDTPEFVIRAEGKMGVPPGTVITVPVCLLLRYQSQASPSLTMDISAHVGVEKERKSVGRRGRPAEMLFGPKYTDHYLRSLEVQAGPRLSLISGDRRGDRSVSWFAAGSMPPPLRDFREQSLNGQGNTNPATPVSPRAPAGARQPPSAGKSRRATAVPAAAKPSHASGRRSSAPPAGPGQPATRRSDGVTGRAAKEQARATDGAQEAIVAAVVSSNVPAESQTADAQIETSSSNTAPPQVSGAGPSDAAAEAAIPLVPAPSDGAEQGHQPVTAKASSQLDVLPPSGDSAPQASSSRAEKAGDAGEELPAAEGGPTLASIGPSTVVEPIEVHAPTEAGAIIVEHSPSTFSDASQDVSSVIEPAVGNGRVETSVAASSDTAAPVASRSTLRQLDEVAPVSARGAFAASMTAVTTDASEKGSSDYDTAPSSPAGQVIGDAAVESISATLASDTRNAGALATAVPSSEFDAPEVLGKDISFSNSDAFEPATDVPLSPATTLPPGAKAGLEPGKAGVEDKEREALQQHDVRASTHFEVLEDLFRASPPSVEWMTKNSDFWTATKVVHYELARNLGADYLQRSQCSMDEIERFLCLYYFARKQPASAVPVGSRNEGSVASEGKHTAESSPSLPSIPFGVLVDSANVPLAQTPPTFRLRSKDVVNYLKGLITGDRGAEFASASVDRQGQILRAVAAQQKQPNLPVTLGSSWERIDTYLENEWKAKHMTLTGKAGPSNIPFPAIEDEQVQKGTSPPRPQASSSSASSKVASLATIVEEDSPQEVESRRRLDKGKGREETPKAESN